jgi:hypothetical protein
MAEKYCATYPAAMKCLLAERPPRHRPGVLPAGAGARW